MAVLFCFFAMEGFYFTAVLLFSGTELFAVLDTFRVWWKLPFDTIPRMNISTILPVILTTDDWAINQLGNSRLGDNINDF